MDSGSTEQMRVTWFHLVYKAVTFKQTFRRVDFDDGLLRTSLKIRVYLELTKICRDY